MRIVQGRRACNPVVARAALRGHKPASRGEKSRIVTTMDSSMPEWLIRTAAPSLPTTTSPACSNDSPGLTSTRTPNMLM
eukprot:7023709-Prymnesium_polylepis.1